MVLHFISQKEVLITTDYGKRVVVFPLSGYINRLQAVASASLLAEELGWECVVVWQPQPVAAAPVTAVFGEDFCRSTVRPMDEVQGQLGFAFSEVPRYLNIHANEGLITLAGHDRGEQVFMSELRKALAENPEFHTLVLVAGGHFGFTEDLSPERQEIALHHNRSIWYQSVALHDDIEIAARSAIQQNTPYLALHLRYTDRSHQVPSKKQIAQALTQIQEATSTRSLFIASDTPAARDEWVSRAQDLGFQPWFIEHQIWDRADPRSSHPALIDWRVLGHAEALVYFNESSFAYEAAVASGNFERSIGLSPHKFSKVRASTHGLLLSAATYPRRHGWFGSR